MKTGTLNLFFLLFMGIFSLSACSKANREQSVINNGEEATLNYYKNQINTLPLQTLSEAEKEALLFMREEEKMSRDVYITLGKKYNTNVFANISSAEQTHMDAVLTLFKRYNLTDPVGTNPIGVFQNEQLQAMYNELVAKGNLSLLNAFRSGATIEDRDIWDLQENLKNVDNQDITFVFNSLLKGSKNHMRAFYRNITRAGGTYTPQYITQAELDLILSGQ